MSKIPAALFTLESSLHLAKKALATIRHEMGMDESEIDLAESNDFDLLEEEVDSIKEALALRSTP